MPISPNFKINIDFLAHLEPKKHSLALTAEGTLTHIDKRSKLKNFLGLLIYLITFTKIPRNEGLDKVTRHILNQAKELNQPTIQLSTEEQTQIKKASEHLFKVIQWNGGKNGLKIQRILTRFFPETISPPHIFKSQKTEEEFKTLIGLQSFSFECSLERPFEELLEDPLFFEVFPQLNLAAQESLLSRAFNVPIELGANKKKFENFLKLAIKMPIESWQRKVNFKIMLYYFNYTNVPIIEAFFSAIDQVENTNHKWQLFDFATKEDLQKPVFNTTKIIPCDIFYICMLSVEQMRRLDLESFEPLVRFIKAIESHTLDLPINKDVCLSLAKNMHKDLKQNFLVFLDSLRPVYSWQHDTAKCLDTLHYFIEWLESIHPEPSLLRESIYVFYGTTAGHFPNSKIVSNLAGFLKKLSYNVIKNHCAPLIISCLNLKNSDPLELILEIIRLLKVEDARDLINKKFTIFNKICDIHHLEDQVLYQCEILRYLSEGQKLNELLSIPMQNWDQFLALMFVHFEKYPWKLLLVLNMSQFKCAWFERLSAEKYPRCYDLLKKYQEIDITEEVNRWDQNLQKFFRLTEENAFDDALNVMSGFSDEMKNSLLHLISHSSPQEICKELPYLNAGEIVIALLDEMANKTLCDAINLGLQQGFLSEDVIRPIVQIAMDMQKGLNEPLKTLLEVFLSHPIDSKNCDFLLSKCYNNATYSDLTFGINSEEIFAHRAFLSLDPELKKYIPEEMSSKNIVKIEANGEQLKRAIHSFYHFQMRDLVNPRSLGYLYNNSEAYSDFAITNGVETIQVHRAILDAHSSYFEGMLRSNRIEATSRTLKVEPGEFDALKAVVEFVYTKELPEFDEEDVESKKAFKAALDYYQIVLKNFKIS